MGGVITELRRVLLAVAVTLVGLAGLVTGGVLSGAPAEENTADPTRPSRPAPSLVYRPGPGFGPVNPVAPVGVQVRDGRLREVTLTGPGGARVPGTLAPDGGSWTATARLRYGGTYTWGGSAVGADGAAVPLTGTVTTIKPARTLRATLNISDGRTVGVAAPIQLQFNGKVADRAAVERALTVTTSVPTEGSWGWLQDENGSRVHWRPKEYWRPGTTVTVSAPLFGVAVGNGAYGAGDVSTTFTVGRAQITRADVRSHRLVVERDGAEVAAYDASYGLDSDPDRNTRSGIHVITEKFADKRMISEQYDYDVMMKWAVRMSNNGEFIHANPGTVGVQGSRNVSHGCVNLSPADARAFFDSALYGDPVEVTGSGVDLSARDGDIWIWTLDWATWSSLSALAP